MHDTVKAMRWRKRWREQDGLVTRGTEEGRVEGEMDWSYLNRPGGTDEFVWCMMGVSPRRQPITDFGLNGITNHGHWPPSSFPISDKPQHTVSIFYPTESRKLSCVCVFIMCLLDCVCVWAREPKAVLWYHYVYLTYLYIEASWCICSIAPLLLHREALKRQNIAADCST